MLPAEFSGKTNGVLTVQGDWRDPDADLRLNYSGGSLAGYPVDGLHTDLRLKSRQLLVQQLKILAGTGEQRKRPVWPPATTWPVARSVPGLSRKPAASAEWSGPSVSAEEP